MRNWMLFLTVAALAVAGCSENRPEGFPTQAPAPSELGYGGALRNSGKVVVANRGSGTISVIDAKDDVVTGTYDLPSEAGEPVPEPMYVVYTPARDRVFVGDRANSRVAVFNGRTLEVEGTVAAGQGVFHMWADPQSKQLWVNNDIDNTSTVIDPKTLETITTVSTPADLVAMGGKPHDVILGPQGNYAYVTVVGVSGPNDYVVQYSTGDFQEMGRAAVGKDAHVSLARRNDWLYVPCQNSDVVIVLNRFTLAMETSIAIPGAHGAGMSQNGKYFYVSNLPGSGMGALYTIDTQSNMAVGAPEDSPYPVPHNIALTPSGHKLFLTHSGASADKVTIYVMPGKFPNPDYAAEVTVGLNPFGLTYVP